VIAVIVAVAIGATVASMYMYIEPRTILRVVYWQIENLLLMTAAVLVYLDRRHARAALARRHAAELARVHASKRTLESRLQAMQARVEPKFLFDTLAQLKQLYESNPAAAERMLEELIAYLRAAMPRMRDTSSTVAQEIELVRAYLAIARIRLHDALDVRIDVPADANDARMPPMMLLPLVGRVVMQGHAPYRHERVSIGVSLNAGRLRLVVGDTGAAFGSGTDEDGIAGIRDRLSALYGDNAQLTLRSRDAEGTEAVVEVPYEPVAAT
jgi:LytS/YehU family sensor histidine kinase